MKSNEITTTPEMEDFQRGGISRRNFITGGALASGALVGAMFAGCETDNGIAKPFGAEKAYADEEEGALGGIPNAMGHVVHEPLICSGCQTCSLICALSHEQLINPKMARNEVNTDIQLGYVSDVLYCQQCDDPKCLKACPTGALHVDETTGARVIDQEVCIGCQTCLNNCIFAPQASRIKYNPETNTCYKCDLCGGDPLCVKRCPLGASMLSWEEYTIVRPQIDDYVAQVTEGAIEGVVFEKQYDGPHAGKAQDEKDWALVVADEGGVNVHGQVTSSDGAELRVRMHCEFFDADGNNLGASEEHQWCMTLHEHLPLDFHFDIDDPSVIAKVLLVGNISYWVSTEDEEY